MDNATNNDTMMEELERRLTSLGIPFSAKDARMRCTPHIIHLAALRLLDAIDGTTSRQNQYNGKGPDGYQSVVTESIDPAQGAEAASLSANGDTELVDPQTETSPSPLNPNSEAELVALPSVIPAVAKVRNSICSPRGTTILIFPSQLRQIVLGTRSSPQRRQKWIAHVKQSYQLIGKLDETAHMLMLDVKTRWSSTHQMLRTCDSLWHFA